MITDLGKNPSNEKINKLIYEHLQGNWITSHRYQEDVPSSFQSARIPWNKKGPWFNAILLYVHNIAKKAIQLDFEGLEAWSAEEVSTWNRKGMLCVYTSVLHACLLHEAGIAKTNELRLIQGYYRHGSGGCLRDFLTMCNVMPEDQAEHVGVHAWITLCNAVLDLSIIQEEICFDFENLPWIVEQMPTGMELIGWTENWKTIKRYAKKFARERNMTYFEWILRHQAEMVMMIDRINREGIQLIAS